MNTIISKTFRFGKIAYRGARRTYPTEVTLELRDVGHGLELSICGAIYSAHGEMLSGGQCLDEMRHFLHEDKTFMRLFRLWKDYHLNGMNAGTARQTAALKAAGIREYDAACEYLKSIGLYVDALGEDETLVCETENTNRNHYEYGHGWILRTLPQEAMREIRELCGEGENAA